MRKNNPGEGTLLEHLEALRMTVWRCVAAVVVFLIPALFFSAEILRWISRVACPPELKLHYFSPFEPLFVQLNLSLVAAVIAAGPFILWQLAAFISPGLYAHEKKMLASFCGFALLLSLCGAALGFFFVIPQVMVFSLSFATAELQPMIGLSSFLKMVVWMILGFALVFELPVALLIPVRAGLLRAESLKKFRYLFVFGIFVLAALLTPPDVVSQLALGIPGWLLFETTVFFAGKMQKRAEENWNEPDDAGEGAAASGGGPDGAPEAPPRSASRGSERSRLASVSRRIRKL